MPGNTAGYNIVMGWCLNTQPLSAVNGQDIRVQVNQEMDSRFVLKLSLDDSAGNRDRLSICPG